MLPRFKGEMTMLSRADGGDRSEVAATSGNGYLPRGGVGRGVPDDEIPFAPQVF